MAKEYIERQRAIVDACNSLELYPSEYAKLEDALNRIPTADVVEVRHGKWIQPHWKNSNYCCNCSECGGEAMHREYQWDKNGIYPLCPHCGAKMDGEGSMRIIKQGRPKATKNILRFRCCRCGCEFEADDTEYEQASQIAYVHDGIIATCICPCCGATVYIP
ncbi:MAG: hypothetical protein MSA89_16050 [Clostridium sp.]|nr:hypothetical protein [Clostridium sp.]